MGNPAIGFGKPENPDKTWEREINGLNFIFSKAREKEGVFLYKCSRRIENEPAAEAGSETSFYSDRDLRPEDVEQLPHFAAFLAGKI
jgi:hypothetical protein